MIEWVLTGLTSHPFELDQHRAVLSAFVESLGQRTLVLEARR